jgi:twitching motility protein PilT
MGLILVTGATGHGKSTTLAAMIDYINTHHSHHILTIEDPIEFIHPLKRGVVNQRQLGVNTLSYASALRAALREDPDVIMIGELRDLETISLAISAAETGHLVLGTLSTSNAPKTIDRIIDSFPPGEQNQIRAMLSESLKAVITQRLIPAVNNDRMILALEILIGTLPVSNLIREGKTFQIPSIMQTGKGIGMQVMDDSIFILLQEGKISAEEASINANNKNRFKGFVEKGTQPRVTAKSM